MPGQQINDNITPDLKRIQAALKKLPGLAYDVWMKNTPIRSGNARRHTNLKSNKIQAQYPYAQRLDEGYSKQSPKGMTEPTEKFIEQEIRKIMGK